MVCVLQLVNFVLRLTSVKLTQFEASGNITNFHRVVGVLARLANDNFDLAHPTEQPGDSLRSLYKAPEVKGSAGQRCTVSTRLHVRVRETLAPLYLSALRQIVQLDDMMFTFTIVS